MLGLMNGNEVVESKKAGKSDESYKKQIESLTKEKVILKDHVKHLQVTNEQLKNKVNVMMAPTYIMEQAKQFSQTDRLEIATTWKEKLDPKSKIKLVTEIIPPRLDDLSENLASLYYWAIGPARQRRALEPTNEIRPDSDPPQNIRELQELVREISATKDKAWLPFYTDMLGVRSEACRLSLIHI